MLALLHTPHQIEQEEINPKYFFCPYLQGAGDLRLSQLGINEYRIEFLPSQHLFVHIQ